MTNNSVRLVLASGSATRRTLLEAAGVTFDVQAADVDEAALRDRMLASGPDVSHESIALALAKEKATVVSAADTAALVIGADQVLSFEGRLLEKPGSVEGARECLRTLRGKTHALHSAVALAENGAIVWDHVASAQLTMRNFSDAALDDYLARAGDRVLTSVGAYQIEGPAVQLFEAIDGRHTTILGLPLLPLIGELVHRGVLRR